jgi:hypothetical protein
MILRASRMQFYRRVLVRWERHLENYLRRVQLHAS